MDSPLPCASIDWLLLLSFDDLPLLCLLVVVHLDRSFGSSLRLSLVL